MKKAAFFLSGIIAFVLCVSLSFSQNTVGVGITITDSNPPIISIISPVGNGGTNSQNLTIAYNATDAGDVSNCTLIFDGSANKTTSPINKSLQQSFNVSNIGLGAHSWKINCTDSTGLSSQTDSRYIYANYLGRFNGSTTNLANYDITNLSSFTLEILPYGKLVFSNVNLSAGYDFDSYADIWTNTAGLNPENIQALNKTSAISLYQLGFSNPRILRNNQTCPDSVCSISSYSAGTLAFTVTGFSSYSAQESPVQSSSSSSSSGGGSGGGGGGGAGSAAGQADKKPQFDFSPNTLKSSIKQGQTIKETIEITNTGDLVIEITADFSDISMFKVYPESSQARFTLNPQEKHEIELNLRATESIAPDLYPSKITFTASGIEKTLPVIIEVESADPLFDADVEILPQSKNAIAGEEVFFEVNLFNVRSVGRVDVFVDYIIKDLEGKVVAAEQETLAVETKASFTRSVMLPSDLAPGTYVAFVKITYGDQVALSSDILEVSAKEIRLYPIQFSDSKFIIAITLSILVFGAVLFSYFKGSARRSPEISEHAIFEKEKQDKFSRELKSLEEAHKSGFISDESFEKEKGRLESRMGKK